jgi:protein O-GlcNAc transferase
LSNVGLKYLIAKTHEEYKELAVHLAKDLKRLKLLREHLQDMMMRSPLCNAKKFTADLEICYRNIWKTWCKSVGDKFS